MDIRSSSSSSFQRHLYKIIPLVALSVFALLAIISPVNFAFAEESVVTKTGTTHEAATVGIPLFNQTPYTGDLFRPKRIILQAAEIEIVHFTYASTVAEILEEMSFDADMNDEIEPDLFTKIFGDTYIKIALIDTSSEKVKSDIPFAITYTVDSSIYAGRSSKVQAGIKGTLMTHFVITYRDGEQISKEKVREEVITEPTTEIIARGSKLSGPASCNYWDGIIDGKTQDLTERYWMKSVMRCESTCNPGAVSPSGAYTGLYQFSRNTFYNARGGNDIYDGHEQIKYTLLMYRAGAQTAWPACNRKALANMPTF